VQLKDRYDELLHELGMDKVSSKKFNDLKSPMPGMVMKLEVQVGDEVKKGDALLVLEAMKMENLLKAQGSGKVKLIKVKAGDKVEKNERLILFE
jgi:biotin carboxyl carrier protein